MTSSRALITHLLCALVLAMSCCVMAQNPWDPRICHQCSHNESDSALTNELCDDPFNVSTTSRSINQCTGSVCTKFFTTSGDRFIRRGCYWMADANLCRYNIEDEETGLVGTYCTCSTHYCNTALPGHSTSTALLPAALVVTLWATFRGV